MPVTTISSTDTTVTITVKNTSPGGDRHTVGLYACWDPEYLEMEAGGNSKVYNNYGVCFWYGYEILTKKSATFTLNIKKVKKTGNTWILACTLDPLLGIFSNIGRKDIAVEAPEAARSKATKKKAKKKA